MLAGSLAWPRYLEIKKFELEFAALCLWMKRNEEARAKLKAKERGKESWEKWPEKMEMEMRNKNNERKRLLLSLSLTLPMASSSTFAIEIFGNALTHRYETRTRTQACMRALLIYTLINNRWCWMSMTTILMPLNPNYIKGLQMPFLAKFPYCMWNDVRFAINQTRKKRDRK